MNNDGFVSISYKVGHKDIWEPRMARINQACYRAELQTVVNGDRDVCTIHVNVDNLSEWMERLRILGLVLTPIVHVADFHGYNHKHQKPTPNKPSHWLCGVTRTHEIGQAFKEAEGGCNHKEAGRLLGFPECCTDAFLVNFRKNFDPQPLITAETTYPECNVTLRYFGARFISHLPCSTDCSASREVAKKFIKAIKMIDPEVVDWVYELLNGPLTWDSYHGIVEVDTPYFLGVTHSFPLMERKIIRKL